MPPRDPIALLLAGQYPDPETGELLAAESRAVVIEDSLDGMERELIAALGAGPRVAVVSDKNTHAVLGARVERALSPTQSIILDDPHANDVTVEKLLAALSPVDLVIAVGTGTLNDLTKMVAHRRGVPQAVFATAPSMNGYTSLSASITQNGMKTSFRTRTPVGVYFDLKVLAAAPPRLIRAGLGDSACRSTAQADWLLSHLVLDRPYREAPFALLAEDECNLLSQTPALLAGDLPTMRHLVRTLVLSGFGMTICNGSYPASQGEHLLSHYVEMMRAARGALHGEQVAVATAAMAVIQQRILEVDHPTLHAPRVARDDVIAHFGPIIGEGCWQEIQQKLIDVSARIEERWDAIRERISAISVPHAQLRQSLVDAGAPVEPAQLGWSHELFGNAIAHAREIRNRYTFLDVLADMGSPRVVTSGINPAQ
jgi:glycerol-1-phosphate dehydrogenase [NAD(P)+]